MTFPVCDKCDCIKGCQSNPVPCPNLLAECIKSGQVSAAQIEAHRVLDAAIAQPGQTCARCHGQGEVYGARSDSLDFVMCPFCNGSGTAIAQPEQTTDLAERIRREIDHCIFNDTRLVPYFGKRKGDLAVRVLYLEAILETSAQPEQKATLLMEAEDWAELYRLREAVKAPASTGFATWQDLAVSLKRQLKVAQPEQPTSGEYAVGYAERFNDACAKPAQPEQPAPKITAYITRHDDGDMLWFDKDEALDYCDEDSPPESLVLVSDINIAQPEQTTVSDEAVEILAREMERHRTQEFEWTPEQFDIWWTNDACCKSEKLRDTARAGLTALRSAIAQLEQTAEPVAWTIFAGSGNMRLWSRKESYVQAQGDELGLPLVPLYTHPAPVRQPLMDDEIKIAFAVSNKEWAQSKSFFIHAARAIEARHGIKNPKAQS